MKSLRNKVQLIGNVGQEPEVQTLKSGSKLARFRMATNETYRNARDERITNRQWHNIVAWNKTAEIIETLVSKGRQIAVSGKLTSRSWEDTNGNKHYSTEVVCNEIVVLGSNI